MMLTRARRGTPHEINRYIEEMFVQGAFASFSAKKQNAGSPREAESGSKDDERDTGEHFEEKGPKA